MNPNDPGLLAYVHPAVGTLALALCFLALRQGLVQRDQRTRKKAAPPANLKRHTRLGPWAVGLFAAALVGGVGSAVVLRAWKPLDSWHGRLALLGALAFGAVWVLGRRQLAGDKRHANTHGLLGLLGLFLGGIAGLLGISLLP